MCVKFLNESHSKKQLYFIKYYYLIKLDASIFLFCKNLSSFNEFFKFISFYVNS